MSSSAPSSHWQRSAPALTLMVVAPLLAEVLPGATRFSALFVFPIEVCVWGGGAVLIRDAVRRWRLGWPGMLFLALALAIAEECLIQQTSLAPMVVHLKGAVYARASGVNYVYFLWALAYEPVFVVFLPISLVELIFPGRRGALWLGRTGLVAVVALFLVGSFLAWYSWTRVARPNVFHVPAYDPPATTILIAVAAICGLLFAALGTHRPGLSLRPALTPPPPWSLGAMGAVWAALWYGLVLLAFGIAPSFPPWIAVGAGLLLAAGILLLLPRWAESARWQRLHAYSVVFGTMIGSMVAGFIGFLGTAGADLYFKILVDAVAVLLMLVLGVRVKRQSGGGGAAETPAPANETAADGAAR